jgi:hypothetical protein
MFDLRKLTLLDVPGERARIRWIRADDPEEIRRLVSIDMDENVRRYVLETSGDEEDLREFAKGTKKSVGVAIAGKVDHVGEMEVDRLQGWIAVYPDHQARLKRAAEKGLLNYDKETVYLEFGFARYPLAKQGQMGSALRCLVASLKSYFAQKRQKLCLTGYTHPNNEGSKRVLAAAGFKHIGEMPYTLKDKHHDCVYLLDFVDK